MTVSATATPPPVNRLPIAFDVDTTMGDLQCSQISGSTPGGQTSTVLLEVRGDLDETLVARMRESLFSAAASSPDRIVIDLAEVSFVGSAGLRTLIAARRRCAAGGTGFALRSPSGAVRRLLSLTHLESVFDVESCRRF